MPASPAPLVQSDLFHATASVTIAPLTGEERDAPLLRIRVEPSDAPPLKKASYVMVDKLTTVRRDRVGEVIGALSREDVLRLDRLLVVFLGIG